MLVYFLPSSFWSKYVNVCMHVVSLIEDYVDTVFVPNIPLGAELPINKRRELTR